MTNPTPEQGNEEWRAIVLMALNGAGVPEEEAERQVRLIEPMMLGAFANIAAETEARVKRGMGERYQPIFDWLFGMNGDFPNLSEPPHYRFRTELQKRLTALEHPEGKQDLPDQAS